MLSQAGTPTGVGAALEVCDDHKRGRCTHRDLYGTAGQRDLRRYVRRDASSNETGSEIATPVITASGSCTAGPPTNASASASATITMSSGLALVNAGQMAAAGPYSALLTAWQCR